uniref:Reprolysin n=1 Tax=Rhipicephalus appendiculatus TaxID=34631 RepID=A0A131YRX3_RHIAP
MSLAIFVCLLFGTATGRYHTRTVFPEIIEERSEHGSLVLQIHDGLALTLTKVSVATEALRLRSNWNGVFTDQTVNGTEIQASLFEDKVNMATVSVEKASYGIKVTGVLNPTERIEPALFERKGVPGRLPHLVHKIKQPLTMERITEEKLKEISPRKYSDMSMPDPVPIEVYIVSDESHNRRFADNDFLVYLCIFMNTIKAIFKNLIGPSVKIVLVGAEKSNKIQESEYIFGSDKLMNDLTSLHMFEKYVMNNLKQYGYPDVVLLLTGRDVYESTHGGIKKNIAGIAYEGGVCTERRVALSEDTPGAFSGIIDAAHELGHSLGASHDGTEPNRLTPGHPGSLNCSAKSGRLMTYVDGGHLRYRFSDCNEKEIRYVLKERGEKCWKINASKTYAIGGVFPGAILKAADYCKRLYKSNQVYVSASYNLKTNCKLKCCARLKSGGHACGVHPMLDHMQCDYKKKCFQGLCTSEKELITHRYKKE